MPCSLPVEVADLGAALGFTMPGVLTLLLLTTTEVLHDLLRLTVQVQGARLTSLLMQVEMQLQMQANRELGMTLQECAAVAISQDTLCGYAAGCSGNMMLPEVNIFPSAYRTAYAITKQTSTDWAPDHLGHICVLSPKGLTTLFHGLIAVNDGRPIRVLVDTGTNHCYMSQQFFDMHLSNSPIGIREEPNWLTFSAFNWLIHD